MSRGSHDSMGPEDVRDLYLDFCKAGRILDVADEKKAACLAEVLKERLQDRARSLVRDNSDKPMMFCYASDATSYLCSVTATQRLCRCGCRLMTRYILKGQQSMVLQRSATWRFGP